MTSSSIAFRHCFLGMLVIAISFATIALLAILRGAVYRNKGWSPLCGSADMETKSAVVVEGEEVTFWRALTQEERDSATRFYRMVRSVDRSACDSGGMVGGRWVKFCRARDGHKFVCFDGMDKKDCLIYSFGAGSDISFERGMARRGCTVRLFDHTAGMKGRKPKGISYHRIGLGNVTRGKLMTLEDILLKFGDAEKEIFYLKVDVEGMELRALRGWITSGAIKNVRQIGMEMHLTGIQFTNKGREAIVFADLIESFQMVHKMGFRVISYDVNKCASRRGKSRPRHFEIVLKHLQEA